MPTNPQRDPIVAAVEENERDWLSWCEFVFTDNRERLSREDARHAVCVDFDVLREKLAARDALDGTLAQINCRTDADAAAGIRGLQQRVKFTEDYETLKSKLAETERERDEWKAEWAGRRCDVGRLERENTRLREALEKLEWSGWQMFDQEGEDRCPGCGAYKRYPHEPKCWLATALAPQTATTETSDEKT